MDSVTQDNSKFNPGGVRGAIHFVGFAGAFFALTLIDDSLPVLGPALASLKGFPRGLEILFAVSFGTFYWAAIGPRTRPFAIRGHYELSLGFGLFASACALLLLRISQAPIRKPALGGTAPSDPIPEFFAVVCVVATSTTILSWSLGILARKFLWKPLPDSATCPICGYDLRASPERCPECGTPRQPATLAAQPKSFVE